MKLSKIYASDSRFTPIEFNEGFNVIFGDIEIEATHKGKVQEHNLGKTALVHLIDFMLLRNEKKSSFFGKNKNKFQGWIFFLEIELNDGKFLTIRRAISQLTKISFKQHFSKYQDLTLETDWDHKDLSINARINTKNPKYIFENEYLQFSINKDFSFRSFLSYLLRTQNDYLDVFKLNRFRGKDIDWKPALFNILGFDSSRIKQKYLAESECESLRSLIKRLQDNNQSNNELYKIRAAIEAKEREKKSIKEEIDSFDFYQKEQNINFDLVRSIETQIADLNKEEYITNHNINKILKSLDSKDKPSLHLDELEKLFNEVQVFFPNNLVKEYQDVVNFSLQITKEREKYLKEELKDLREKYLEIISTLKNLNVKKTSMLSILQEKDTFVKYKQYQEDLIKIENEIFDYKNKLESARTIENYENSLEGNKEEIKELSVAIKEQVDSGNPDYQEIKSLFQDIYKKTFEYTALLLVIPNSKGNVDFTTTVLNSSQDLTGKGDGYTATKVACASFVLAILIHYSSKSFFRFAYHDGVLDSWGDSHKIYFMELVREYCKKSNIQYTISLIKSDVPQGFDFLEGEIIRTLSKSDPLFGFEF